MSAESSFDRMPLVAILRGVTPDRVAAVADVLVGAGIRTIEVPLNSPEPFKSIRLLREKLDASCLCGAGTVLTREDVDRTHDAGGRLIVAPNSDPFVIARAIERGMVAMPGFATASEAFLAIRAGATRLKLFPAATYGASHLAALRAVLPAHARVYAVGGIGAEHIPAWAAAGASGFGFGSELFKQTYTIEDVRNRAQRLVEATERAMSELSK
jgi:2-dehydro-3-deoxyphosphogalactonate aldolase